MINFDKITHIWFVGIGGIGMSALARYFSAGGFITGGYDRTESALTGKLEEEKMSIIYNDDPGMIPGDFKKPGSTLVIYTPAIPAGNKVMQFFGDREFTMRKRSEVLGLISGHTSTLAVAGTHGKTSVSTLLAHILKMSSLDCSAFLGGIAKNYNTNLLIGKSNISVMEADEFDRSFHHLKPSAAIITSLDADHLDVYGTYEKMVDAYNIFLGNTREGGMAVINKSIESLIKIPGNIDKYTYGLDEGADFHAVDIRVENEAYRFNIKTPKAVIENLYLLLPGRLNVENAVAAVSLAKLYGVEDKEIRKALLCFKGVKRRTDLRIGGEGLVYIDDYAHHPEEIEYFISSVRDFYPGRQITGIFQPHLYSRTRDHAEAFAAALDKLDSAILLPVYPAREKEIEGVDSGLIYSKMKLQNRVLAEKKDIPGKLDVLKENDVLVTMGAGDIDRMVEDIETILKEKQ